MKITNENIILISLRFFPIIFILIISLLLTYFILIDHSRSLENDKKEIIEQYIKNNKNMIETNINTVNKYINEEVSNTKHILETNIKSQVYTAHTIMTSMYNAYKNSKSKKEIKELIKNALENIRFNNGRGYFFIYELNGTNIFHPTKPRREGKSFFNTQDINGTYIVQESINIAKSKSQEGFQNWFFHKPNQKNKEYEKIGFIKKFEPYNWFVGTGEYIEDFNTIIKDKLLEHISILSYVNNKYIFVIDYDGNVLVKDNKKFLKKEIFKTKRLDTFKEFILSTKKDTFVEYKIKNIKLRI